MRVLVSLTLAACALVMVGFVVLRGCVLHSGNAAMGITFSSLYAEELGLDAHAAFLALLDDMAVRRVRLPMYWNAIEPMQGERQFADVRWYLDEAAKRDVAVTLVVGMKVPRWPECHVPAWVTDENRREALLSYMTAAVTQFAHHPAVVRWQVENEPHFPFGKCPPADLELLTDEIALVRSLVGDTPLQLTVSGEQEPWIALAPQADVLGVSIYRFAWNGAIGLVVFPHPAAFYGLQAASLARTVDTVIISELQAEPWFDGERPSALTERYASFTADRLRDHLRFARETGIDEVYLWGAEWWYALREQGDDRLWEAAKEYFEL